MAGSHAAMASISTRDGFNAQSLGVPLNTRVKEAWILMVGAGGIGCELLKNLVLSGFGHITIVDLDTIDLSNLNRQFLFRHEHIKKSKALVAKEAALRFNPNVEIDAKMANIKDGEFNIDWFKQFTLVFNALDNLDARRHVNKMCLAADVPLIESGTTGFNGQVQVIKKGVTACYDCTPKETPKSFPVCTIRSTPSQPIHCIVWGKSYLMSEIFGASEDEAPELDHTEDSENAKEIEKLRQESQALKKIRETMGTESFVELLFNKVYKEDVERLRSMEEMWKTRRPPEPLEYAAVINDVADDSISKQKTLQKGQLTWSLNENVLVFKDSLERLSKRMAEMKASKQEPVITFDKDDEDTLDFVTAAANLRSIVFGIETRSRFDIKQMAGNIIPAIATTNAIVAGLCVLESFKVLQGDYSKTKERLLASDKIRGPNEDCPVCGVAQTRILVDMSRATLNDLVEGLLREELNYGEEIVVNHGSNLLYDIDETDQLDKKLSELGIKADSFLTVIDDDDTQDMPRINLMLNVQESSSIGSEEKPIKSVDIVGPSSDGEAPSSPIARRKKPVPHSNGTDTEEVSKTNGITPTSQSNGNGNGNGTATKRSATDAFPVDTPPLKKAKVDSNGSDSIIIDDGGDEAILIDD